MFENETGYKSSFTAATIFAATIITTRLVGIKGQPLPQLVAPQLNIDLVAKALIDIQLLNPELLTLRSSAKT